MTLLRTRCTRCHTDLTLAVTDVVVAISTDGPGGAPSEVLVSCHHCDTTTLRHLDPGVARALVEGGAAHLVSEPVSAPEPPERRPQGLGPMTLDDLLTLHEGLASPDWLAELQSDRRPSCPD